MNSQLYDKKFSLPFKIVDNIKAALNKYPNVDGIKRAKFLIKNGDITYQAMKRLKNFFDYYKGDDNIKYELAGGDLMKSFIDRTLNKERDSIKRSDNIKRDINVDVNLGNKFQKNPRMNIVNENIKELKNVVSLAIIVNENNQILLLKRSENEDWEPNKWALVGGSVENNEEPVESCKREIKEETGLIINNFKEKFKIDRENNLSEYIFITKYDGDPFNIKLNFEHVAYGWFFPDEIKFLDHVPNLTDYINIAFKKY